MKLMQRRRLWLYSKITLVVVSIFVVIAGTSTAFAVTSSSLHYQVTETQFNSGLSQQSCSIQYCAQVSIGDSTDGNPTSSGSATFDNITNNEPVLQVIVEAGASNLGTLTTETTATKITTVKVKNYMSGGYILQISGDPPKYGDHKLATSNSPQSSMPGTEQFGINAAANTNPNVGAAPLQVPSNQVVFGMVGADYKIPNMFKYISGDEIARSTAQSGQTDYTISMIVNISSSTPAGHYSGDFSAMVIPIY